MSTGSPRSSDKRKTKELKVFELYHQGLSYRRIANEARLSLRDVAKSVRRISNKTKSPSTISVMDEVVLRRCEYRVNLLRSEVRDLELERQSLKDELAELRSSLGRAGNQEYHPWTSVESPCDSRIGRKDT
jgi:hypothetical protein